MSVSVGDSSHLEQLLHRGRIDVAFIQRPENTESFEPIDFPPIGLKALVPSAPLPGAPAGTHRLEESGHQPLALMRRVEGSGTFEAILGQLRRAGIHPNVKLDVSDPAVAVEFNRTAAIPGELVGTDVEVDPVAELSGVYRHVGACGTCLRPTRKGPAMLFNKVKGFENFRVAIGLLSTRQRAGRLLDCAPERLGFLLKDSVRNPIPPVVVGPEKAQCREIVHLASDPDSDLRTLLPAPTNTPEDAGPCITMGMCHASDPETGESDITIHRLCVHSRDELSMWLTPGRHIDAFRIKAEAAGTPMRISIGIGVDPAIEIAACFEPPATPQGFGELQIAGRDSRPSG